MCFHHAVLLLHTEQKIHLQVYYHHTLLRAVTVFDEVYFNF